MKNSQNIKREEFDAICNNLLTIIIPKTLTDGIKTQTVSKEIYGTEKTISTTAILTHPSENLIHSIAKRVAISYCIINSYENNQDIDLIKIWPYLSKSLKVLNELPLIASVGSQGFISIPIYRQQSDDVKILRLHIWDNSIDKLIDLEKNAQFSIHSHLFHATSQILCGEIKNTMITVNYSPKVSEYSEYQIKWRKIKNNLSDNNLKSELINTEKLVSIQNISEERYTLNKRYSIKEGDFHISNYSKKHTITASVFLFNSKTGRIESSKTIGPKHLAKAPELNYPEMNVLTLLEKIDTL
jgi:hypothetical protein